MSEPLITAEAVAELLSIKVSTVYDAASKGRIPCVRLWQGRRKCLLRFRRCELDEWLRARSQAASTISTPGQLDSPKRSGQH